MRILHAMFQLSEYIELCQSVGYDRFKTQNTLFNLSTASFCGAISTSYKIFCRFDRSEFNITVKEIFCYFGRFSTPIKFRVATVLSNSMNQKRDLLRSMFCGPITVAFVDHCRIHTTTIDYNNNICVKSVKLYCKCVCMFVLLHLRNIQFQYQDKSYNRLLVWTDWRLYLQSHSI